MEFVVVRVRIRVASLIADEETEAREQLRFKAESYEVARAFFEAHVMAYGTFGPIGTGEHLYYAEARLFEDRGTRPRFRFFGRLVPYWKLVTRRELRPSCIGVPQTS